MCRIESTGWTMQQLLEDKAPQAEQVLMSMVLKNKRNNNNNNNNNPRHHLL